MTEQEKELMKNFKVEELEERLEMKLQWGGSVSVDSTGLGKFTLNVKF